MSEYAFFAAQLRFVAARTDRSDEDVSAMMDVLVDIADQTESTGQLTMEPEEVKVAGRALAGVAGFLQQHILPEAVAAQNEVGERQVRWVIDTAMEVMTAHLTRAELPNDGELQTIDLPKPPAVWHSR